MRDSADSYDPAYGRVRRASKRQRKHSDDEETFAKRDLHLQRLVAEDADDATDGLPEGDRWSTWDAHGSEHPCIPRARLCPAVCSSRYHGQSAIANPRLTAGP